jgi:general secretion pathway protein D
MRRPFDPNNMTGTGGEPNGPRGMRFGMPSRSGPDGMRPPEPNEIIGPGGEPMEAINLKDVEMKDIIQKLAAWTGKVIIPSDDAMKQRVTIYAPDKLPRSQALSHIYSALRMKGFIAEQEDKVIYLKPIKDAKLGFVPTVDANQPLAAIENKDAVVQKFFRLQNYRPTQMGALIQPLVGEHGYVSADETTGTLLVIDTVGNLMRIERIISEFDVPEAEQAVTQIFEIKHGDPAEIVQLLRILLGVTDTRARTGTSTSTTRSQQGGRFGQGFGPGGMSITVQSQPSSGDSGSQQARTESRPTSSTTGGAATSVVVGQTQGPIVLIAEPRRKWIIARASAETIKQIGEWIDKLDVSEPVESEYEVVPLIYASSTEVEASVENAMRDMPGMELMPSVLIEPTEGQVIVFGRKDLRELVKKLIAEIDVPPGQLETQHFKLNYADPDQVKTNIDDLYSQTTTGAQSQMSRGGFGSFGGFTQGRRTTTSRTSDMVKVISYASLKQVTVIASPENMKKIAEQIKEWDKPIDVKEVKPRIIELHNSDPVQMADLLTKLFTQEDTGSSASYIVRYVFSESQDEQKKKIVGALYGQLTFEDVPGTKKIIVISKIPEAYDVIEELIRELDKQEMGEIPKVIQLKYADPEDLAERLNAMFNQQGTSAPIRRSAQGLSSTSTQTQSSTSTGTSSTSSTSGTTTGTTTGTSTYTPWWSAGRTSTTEAPISNVIGKVRFIPDPHSKSMLVLAPPEFMEKIEEVIRELDVPGKQVMVKAVIIEVKHSDVTSLGLQLASNPQAFGTLEENSITALNQLIQLDKHGAALFTSSTAGSGTGIYGTTISGTTITGGGTGVSSTIGSSTGNLVTSNVSVLVDFLIKKVHAKILNQQTLWTKDNGEASFFKGDNVAFLTSATAATGLSGSTQNLEFQRVGMTLRVRPRITPEKNVDMVLNIILAQLTAAEKNSQPVRSEMETTTNMIVQNGQTVMLGGILFQEDSKIQRKIPLFGDLPLVGPLFRHNELGQSNNELIVFVTPYVIDEGQQLSPESTKEMAQPLERLQEVQGQLKNNAEALEQQSK